MPMSWKRLPRVSVPDSVKNKSFATRAGQINKQIQDILDTRQKCNDVSEEIRVEAGGLGMTVETHRMSIPNQERRLECLQDELKLRERLHDFYSDVLDALEEKALQRARDEHKAAVNAVRVALDKAGLHPIDADAPRRGSILGRLIHHHVNVQEAKGKVQGVEARIASMKKDVQKNEEAARALPDLMKASKSAITMSEKAVREAEEAAEKAERRREEAARKVEERRAKRHPFTHKE